MLLIVLLAIGMSHAPAGHAETMGKQCNDTAEPAARDPSNPLALANPPGTNDPIRGAKLWVAGPSHSAAAGAIIHLLGTDRNQKLNTGVALRGFPDSESYADFLKWVDRKLPHYSKHVQYQVHELEKSAGQPATVRVNATSGGGAPADIYAQTRKFVCQLWPQDPGSVMQLSTYFLQPTLGGCATTAKIDAYAPKFKAQINAVSDAIAANPMIVYAEEDAVGASHCMASKQSLGAWEALMKYEVDTLERNPHTVVYIEGGYDDSQDAAYAASVLNPGGIHDAQGFFTNDTHFQWDSNEWAYAEQISRRTGGAHFVINTADNGRGPLYHENKARYGIEQLCNPPDRGLGVRPTTTPALPGKAAAYPLDGFTWTYPPGFSVGTCHGGPASGYWPELGVSLGAHANSQYGPGYKSEPW
ncbi:MAG: glycoside hydrolase family 6 protein [Solirubrobacterales bacterium]|nr:glycoside hydrolase family 6 protein [Solirubrobacterales bacterium]